MPNFETGSALFSHNTDEWETPQNLFDELNKEFYFGIDVCATHENAKCKNYFSKKDDGLKQNWGGYGTIWCNPPYGRAISWWVRKASEEASKGNTTVMLIPSRTDTHWFHDYVYQKPNVEIRFIKGRIKFGGAKYNAPFPSMILIFRGDESGIV